MSAPRPGPPPRWPDLAAVDFPFLTDALLRAVRDTAPHPVTDLTGECRLRTDLGYGPSSLRKLSGRVARLLSMPHLPPEPVRGLRFVADLVDLVDVLLAEGAARPPGRAAAGGGGGPAVGRQPDGAAAERGGQADRWRPEPAGPRESIEPTGPFASAELTGRPEPAGPARPREPTKLTALQASIEPPAPSPSAFRPPPSAPPGCVAPLSAAPLCAPPGSVRSAPVPPARRASPAAEPQAPRIPSREDPPMPQSDDPVEFTLGSGDAEQLRALADTLRDGYPDPGTPEFYDRAWPAAADVPYALRDFLERFRRKEPAAACLIHGFPVDDEAIGPTPGHWDAATAAKATAEQELYLALCAMVLGEPFAWETLQAGRMIQNILPIAGDEKRQSGHGSQSLLEFHTEDGFHPRRCDYLLLMGMRNRDEVPTIVASVRDVDLPVEDREVLGQARFHIVPDSEHIRQLEAKDPDHPALADMYRMLHHPEPTAVLFGRPESPYLRIDRPFMYCAPGDNEAERALDRLMAELERVQRDVVLGPGTLIVLDNHLAVHGRRAFVARYDGTDRWLKKITASRDLRRGLAPAGGSGRVIA